MGRGVNGGHPVLDVFIKQWPSLIFLPAILGLIVVLVAVTRWWDQRDKSRFAEKEARRADAPARPTGDEVIASPPPPGDRSRRRWRRRSRCDCSWHTICTNVADLSVSGTPATSAGTECPTRTGDQRVAD
jgi:hypothetical protein